MSEARECLIQDVLPALAANGVHVVNYAALTAEQKASVDEYFREIIFPVLTPLAFDPGRPFPHISNLSLNLAVVVRHGGVTKFARVKLPDVLPRFVPLPERLTSRGSTSFVFLEDVVRANLARRPVFGFFFVAHLFASTLFLVWAILYPGLPQFSEVGIID